MPYCTTCGSEISESDKFCGDCGNPVKAIATKAPGTQATTKPSENRSKGYSEGSTESWSRRANWVHGGRGVGGKLRLFGDRLVFESHAAERAESLFSVMGFLGKYLRIFPNETYQAGTVDGVEIDFEDVEGVEKEPPRQRGLKDTLYGGGLRTRLKINVQGGDEELFIINGVEEVKSDIEEDVQSIGR